MGLGLWFVAGGAAFFLARFVRPGRSAAWWEVVAALLASALAGAAATAMDFGGWNEPDWRAGAFVFCCAAAAIAMVRLLRLARSPAATS